MNHPFLDHKKAATLEIARTLPPRDGPMAGI